MHEGGRGRSVWIGMKRMRTGDTSDNHVRRRNVVAMRFQAKFGLSFQVSVFATQQLPLFL